MSSAHSRDKGATEETMEARRAFRGERERVVQKGGGTARGRERRQRKREKGFWEAGGRVAQKWKGRRGRLGRKCNARRGCVARGPRRAEETSIGANVQRDGIVGNQGLTKRRLDQGSRELAKRLAKRGKKSETGYPEEWTERRKGERMDERRDERGWGVTAKKGGGKGEKDAGETRKENERNTQCSVIRCRDKPARGWASG